MNAPNTGRDGSFAFVNILLALVVFWTFILVLLAWPVAPLVTP